MHFKRNALFLRHLLHIPHLNFKESSFDFFQSFIEKSSGSREEIETFGIALAYIETLAKQYSTSIEKKNRVLSPLNEIALTLIFLRHYILGWSLGCNLWDQSKNSTQCSRERIGISLQVSFSMHLSWFILGKENVWKDYLWILFSNIGN